MFDPSSRYVAIDTTTYIDDEGKEHAHLRRRFVANPSERPIMATVTVVEGDRIDRIASRELGDSLGYWRICDDNRAMHPAELTGTPGRRLVIRLPGGS